MQAVPVKYVLHGDRQKCKALRGQARRVMHILENMMCVGGLEQQTIKLIPYPGALIIAQKIFGARVIHIYTGIPLKKEEEAIKRCICNCNFSVGYIFEIQQETIDGVPLYSVMACVGTNRYVLFTNILASDFTPYELYQKVILIPYNRMKYLCCVANTQDSSKGCSPSISLLATSEAEWRTTYRIIPWCAITIPSWVVEQ